MPGDKKLLTVPEAADRLRVSVQTVYALASQGRLPAVRIGTGRGVVRICEEDLQAYIASCRRRPAPTSLKHIRSAS